MVWVRLPGVAAAAITQYAAATTSGYPKASVMPRDQIQ
jgi:hypothetical protein